MDIDIQALHSEVEPRWRTLIERRAGKLTEICGDIVRLHVTMVHSAHHHRGDEEVRLLASVPNDTLRVQKSEAGMSDAIHAAFAAMEHEIRAFVERRRLT